MKHDKAWVLKTAQCPDGTAWGLEYVKTGGKTVREALGGFHRADWLLWYLVKTDTLSIEMAFDLCTEILKSRVEIINGELGFLHSESLDLIARYRSDCAGNAETAMTVGMPKQAHSYMALTFLFRFKYQLLSLDFDEALKDGQCVLNNLVAAKTGSLNFETYEAKQEQEAICDWLRSRVKVSK